MVLIFIKWITCFNFLIITKTIFLTNVIAIRLLLSEEALPKVMRLRLRLNSVKTNYLGLSKSVRYNLVCYNQVLLYMTNLNLNICWKYFFNLRIKFNPKNGCWMNWLLTLIFPIQLYFRIFWLCYIAERLENQTKFSQKSSKKSLHQNCSENDLW